MYIIGYVMRGRIEGAEIYGGGGVSGTLVTLTPDTKKGIYVYKYNSETG